MYELKLVTQGAGIITVIYDSTAQTLESFEAETVAKYGTFVQLDVKEINPVKP